MFTAGGIIVPGYISLYLHQPIQVIITIAVAILVWGFIQILGNYMFLYGKRRIVLALLLGFSLVTWAEITYTLVMILDLWQ